jgi:hypothetical protein
VDFLVGADREKESFAFGNFVFRLFFGWVGSFLGLPCGKCCPGPEFVPVVSIVADEVGDFTEGLIRDSLLEGHVLVYGGGSVDDGEL